MISTVSQILLEKAASDNGFDLALDKYGNWLSFASSHATVKLWLAAGDRSPFIAAFSDSNLMAGLLDLANVIFLDLPVGATTAFSVTDIKPLYPLLRRAFQLSRSLPNKPLNVFEKATCELPRSTETERLVIQRVGQNIFRSGLMDYWDGKCAVTGLSISELLIASHIKPWKDCDSDTERLDVFNGLLLAPHFDAAFDLGFITFEDDGSLVASLILDDFSLKALGIDKTLKLKGLTEAHKKYLKWHRENEFSKQLIRNVCHFHQTHGDVHTKNWDSTGLD